METKIVKGHPALGKNRVIFNLKNELFCGTLYDIQGGNCVVRSKSFDTVLLLSYIKESSFKEKSINTLPYGTALILEPNHSYYSNIASKIATKQNNYYYDKVSKGVPIKKL